MRGVGKVDTEEVLDGGLCTKGVRTYIVDERCWKSAFRGGVGWKVAYRRGAYR